MITVTKVGDLYKAEYKPRNEDNVWKTDQPKSAEDIIRELTAEGAHQTDVFDALKLADPKRFSRSPSR